MSFPENTSLPDPLPTGPQPLPDLLVAAPDAWPPNHGFRRYERLPGPRARTYALHLGLFVLTLLTTTLAGVQLTQARESPIDFVPVGLLALPWPALRHELQRGLWYALPFLGVLTVHEFGHYFTGRYNRVRTSLPYFVPFPLGLGTFGAVIRIKDQIFSRREFFDIGVAGPLAGFAVAVPLLIYGFTHLPPLDYLFRLHPEYAQFGADYARHVYPPGATGGIVLARPLLFRLLAAIFADPARLPHPNELMHYPMLLAGALSLFFTALNLLPLGQLDGGHILYGLLGGRRFNRLATGLFTGFVFYAGLGLFSVRTAGQTWLYWGLPYALYLGLVCWRVLPTPRQGLVLAGAIWAGQLALASAVPGLLGNPGWLLFGLLLGRFTGIYHPPAPDDRRLSIGRQWLGWGMVVIFVLCFTPSPFR